MCSVGDDVESQSLKFMQEKQKFKLTDSKCTKCRTQEPKIVLNNKYPYCKECFIASTVHKFKALLGKTRVVYPNDNILVNYEPGHPSTALLHFIRTGLNLTTPKKLKFSPIVVYIECHHYLPINKRKTILKQIKEEITNFNFTVHFISLVDYLSNPDQIENLIHSDFNNMHLGEDDTLKIKEIIKKKSCAATFQIEVLDIYKQDILRKVAKHLQCKCIFTPDIAIHVASKLLTNVSLGRGAHVGYDIAAVDTRDEDVKLVKPLRQFTIKELAFYNFFNNLEPVCFLKPTQNPYSSVQSLMEKFVSDLQLNYPATISTVVRTGDKLSIDESLQSNPKCLLCRAPTDGVSESEMATQFSHWVSTQPSNLSLSIEERTNKLIKDFNETRKLNYCFACSQIAQVL